MAIKHSHRHRTRWKIIELRSANAKKHFALFFVVVVAAQSSPPAWARGHFRAHPSGQQQNIVSFPINRQATTLRRGGCFALALSSSSSGSKSCGNVFRFGHSFFVPPFTHSLRTGRTPCTGNTHNPWAERTHISGSSWRETPCFMPTAHVSVCVDVCVWLYMPVCACVCVCLVVVTG